MVAVQPTMSESLESHLRSMMGHVDGLRAIVITDRDGVPVLKVSDNSLPSLATRPPFLSTLAMGAEQQGKLALGSAKSLICLYESYQVVVLNKSPMLVSLIASENANTGQLLDMDRLMGSLLDALLPALLPDHLAPTVV